MDGGLAAGVCPAVMRGEMDGRLLRLPGQKWGWRVGLAGMKTTTKKDFIDQITEQTKEKRSVVKKIVQCFLAKVITELSEGHRLEFRDFGVFETRERAPRVA